MCDCDRTKALFSREELVLSEGIQTCTECGQILPPQAKVTDLVEEDTRRPPGFEKAEQLRLAL